MKGHFCIALGLSVLFHLMNMLAPGDVLGKSEYVIGGEEHPWIGSGTIEHLDMTTDPGSIRVIYVDPTQNLALWLDPKDIYGTRPIPNTQITEQEKVSMVDGDPTTAYVHRPEVNVYTHTWHVLAVQFDLGDLFPVNRIRFRSREEFRNHLLTEYAVRVAEEFPGRARWHSMGGTPIIEDRENLNSVVDLHIPLQPIRFVEIQPLTPTKTWELAEVEVYGEGYLPTVASYTSDVIPFDSIVNWGKIRWSGWRDPGAKVEIQTRTGDDDDPNVYWRRTGVGDEEVRWSASGLPLTKKEYYAFKPDERGRITHDVEQWSFWSPPYDFEKGLKGVPISSPGPRRYIQVNITITPTNTEGAGLDFIAFEFSRKVVAREVVAEVYPTRVFSREVSAFTYALRPRIKEGDTGFDRLEIKTPVRADTIRAVRIDGKRVNFIVVNRLDDGFMLRFPKVERDQTLVEVDFDCLVLRYTSFDGYVSDSSLDELHQSVEPGNATDRLISDRLSVETSLEEPLFVAVMAAPNPFTPNGDGINDVLHISYYLLKLVGPAPVSLDIYDLSGALVKRVHEGKDESQRYIWTWDGRDEEGHVVRPGAYLYHLSVRADEKEENKVGTVAVVY